MDEYHSYLHRVRSANDGKDNDEKHVDNKKKSKPKTESAELLKLHDKLTKSKQNKLSFMEKDILNCLQELDEKQQTTAPYIDQKQIYEIKHIYGKNGKYTQYLITQYNEYSDCFSDISLPPIPEKQCEEKQKVPINVLLSDSNKMDPDKNESNEVDDKLHDESREPTTIDIQQKYDDLKEDEMEEESVKTKQSKIDKLRAIEDKTKSKRNLVSWMIYK